MKDVSTITDVCSSENLPEVEIITLVQDQIPCYKLKADVLSEFAGYDNVGWTVPFPALRETEVEALSPEQAEGALAYFVLCGNRVSQMTHTYHDIEAVTRLLEEKEKDLELAARIGQQLLARNRGLEEKNSALENEICFSSEKITQLKHDLQMKTELLQIYSNDVEDSSADATPTTVRHINIDILQKRVKNLECENINLREEATQLASDTQFCEEKEKELVHDVIKQLTEANLQVHQLSEELSKKIENSLRQQEETTQLLAQLVDLQATNKRLTKENEALARLVGVARECQEELTTELAELKERYAEVLDLLHDTQKQLRRVHKKNVPSSRGTNFCGLYNAGYESIATELYSLNASSGDDKVDGAKCLSRVFDTVRLSSKLATIASSATAASVSSAYSTPSKLSGQSRPLPNIQVGAGGRYSPYFGGGGSDASSGLPSLDSGADSDGSFHTDGEDNNYPASCSGVPGWPGTPDLDNCLRRLGPAAVTTFTSAYFPYGCRTPDSIMSTGSGRLSSGYSDWKFPQKLQIVKPIEGSLTLHQWSRLATPHLGGLLEEKEGVAVKGATNVHLNLELYSMSDFEEEEEKEELPGKQFMNTSGVFTFTNSTVLHPDEVTSITPSLLPIQPSILPSTAGGLGSVFSSPTHSSSLPSSRRGSTATFSTNVGLAKHLMERGVDGGNIYNIVPTVTPANSPENSRPGSPESYASKLPGLNNLSKTFHYGASFLRRTLYGGDPPTPTSPMKEGFTPAAGIGRFTGIPQTVGGIVTSRPAPPNPLQHLSHLIQSGAQQRIQVASGSPSGLPIKIPSPGERRPHIPEGATMGIPAQPGSGQLEYRLTNLKPGQRSDLGTVNLRRPTSLSEKDKIGTIEWTSLGRKGGLL